MHKHIRIIAPTISIAKTMITEFRDQLSKAVSHNA